jgi:DNA-binding transcriptional MocR family regulator
VARRFGVPIVDDDPYGFLPTTGPPPFATIANPIGFHLWVSLPEPWTRSAFVGHMRSTGIGVVASDAFATEGVPPEAARVCLGGPPDRAAVRSALEFMAHALEASPARTSTFL